MLTDLEADVLYAIEGRPEFGGAWRVDSRGGGPSRVVVAMTTLRGAVHLIGIPDAHRIEWFQPTTTGTLPRGAVAIALGEVDRVRARSRAEDRRRRDDAEAARLCPPISPPPFVTHLIAKPPPRRRAPIALQSMRRFNSFFSWAAPLDPVNAAPAEATTRATEEPIVPNDPDDARRNRCDTTALAGDTRGGSSSHIGTTRVLAVSRDSAFMVRLREMFGTTITLTHVENGWAVLDRAEETFDRVVWHCDTSEPGEPTEAQFLKLLARSRPALARATYFVVDAARCARIQRESPKIAARFIEDTDADLRRIML